MKTTILLDDMIHFRQEIYDNLPRPAFHIKSAQDLVNTLDHFKKTVILGNYNLLVPSHFHFNYDYDSITIPESFNNGKSYEFKRTGTPYDVLNLYKLLAFGSDGFGTCNPPIPALFITASEHDSIYSSSFPHLKQDWARIAKVPVNEAKLFKVSEDIASKSIGFIISNL